MELMNTLTSGKKSHTLKNSTSFSKASHKKTVGFTLINLLTALTVSGLLFSNGIPAISQTYYHHRASASYDELFTLIQFTRTQAVNYHTPVLLCPTIDNINCIDDWDQALMIFVDTNDNKINDGDEVLVRIREKLKNDEAIKWNVSGSRRYLRFKADGSTGNQNGRLSYCLYKGRKLYAKQIVMTMAGRARRGKNESAIEKCSV